MRLKSQVFELQAALAEADRREAAAGDVLRLIATSPADVQPVFDAIAERATRLCDALHATVYRIEDGQMHFVATCASSSELVERLKQEFPQPLSALPWVREVLAGSAFNYVPDVEAAPGVNPALLERSRRFGFRALVNVPMRRDGSALGLLAVVKAQPASFTDKQIALLQTFADQAVIAIENVRLFTELQARNADLTSALAQQTATAEILRVISSSPSDEQPVFDAIVQSAQRLLSGHGASLSRVVGDMLHLAALTTKGPVDGEAMQKDYPRPIAGHAGSNSRAVRDRAPAFVTDMQTDPAIEPRTRELARLRGFRSVVSVPMLHEGEAIGAISVTRPEAGPFTAEELSLLQTFADQAVIAIENVRLFTELQARNRDLATALDQQTATSEILRVISSSPTDVQPVFDAIAQSSRRLLGAHTAAVWRLAGDAVYRAALSTTSHAGEAGDAALRARDRGPLDSSPLMAMALREQRPAFTDDAQTDPRIPNAIREIARTLGFRSLLVVPMVRDGTSVGSIHVSRAESGPFSDDQIAVLRTFADQAVIAVENVRLFTELETRNRDLTTSLEQQTATGDILRIISRSGTDVQPVFDAIADSALRLLHGWGSMVVRFDGQLLHAAAIRGGHPGSDEVLREQFPTPPLRGSIQGAAILDREVKHIADIETDDVWRNLRSNARARGWRANLTVPMLQDGEPIGVIGVTRTEPGAFSSREVELLKTFADQALIAIENARLLTELQQRTRELTRSVDQLTALGDVGRAVSSSLDLEIVLTTIVTRANDLCGTDGAGIFEFDHAAGEFHLRATKNFSPELIEVSRTAPLRRGEGLMGRVAETRQPTQVADITVESAYQSRVRDIVIRNGYRALLSVPLLRDEDVIGALTVARKTAGAFPPDVVDLLRTFAAQSSLAIQNARLFREIEVKSRELQVVSQHKSEFLASMSHELRTPLNAIIGFSDVLLEGMFGETNEKQTEYLRDILASGQHLLSLINDILDLSKIEAGRMELELTDFDVSEAVDNALILMRERASRRGLHLERTVDERVGEIRADERKVKQVLLNLLSNAVKFTPEGGRIMVRAVLVDGMAEISVTDTGVGIAPEDHEAVFEEFRQVGRTDKKAEGTGLGLALCRRFVELHGGRIWVKSQLGAGSTFAFTLPLLLNPASTR